MPNNLYENTCEVNSQRILFREQNAPIGMWGTFWQVLPRAFVA